MASGGGSDPFVVATRTDVDRRGAGFGDPPFALQGAHRERRPTGTRLAPAPGWDLPSTLSSRRMMAGPPGRSGQKHCWSPGRRRSCSGTPASDTSWSRLSMLLCRRWWKSCRMSSSSLPRSSRAGYRSAQDPASRFSSATLVSRHAAGGTVGGSADDRFLLLVTAECGAPRRHSSSWS